RLNRPLPGGKHLVPLAGIAANADRSPDVIEHDSIGGKGPCKIGKLVNLRVIEPSIVAEAEPAQDGEALAKGRLPKQPRRRVIGGVAHFSVLIPGAAVAYAAEAMATGAQMGFEHGFDPTTEAQVGVTDNAGTMTGVAVDAAGTHGRGPVDEFGFADVFHLDGTAGAEHGAGLNEDGGNDIVAAVR